MDGLELRHLRYFVAVAEELHFGRAARRLHMAQPPLSQQIRRLEEIVGAPLLARTSRSVALTPAGAAFLERARRLLAAAAEGVDEAARIGRGEAGTLDVGFVSSAITLGVPERLQWFRARFPEVHTRLHEGQTSQITARLERGEVDLGIVRDAEDRAGVFDTTVIATEGFVAVLPVGHRLATRRRLDVRALRDEPFVFYPVSAGPLAYRRNLLEPCHAAGFEPRIVQEGSSWVTIFHLVGVGVGVTIAPASAAEIRPATVVAVPLSTRARSEVQVVVRTGDDRPVVARFLASRGAS
ncbi:LysR substrate-binding domain-containing protein [Baekduia sp. Peel2402]|uniref:LysR substrate-binding domain-containing protein n=1 Tax=Baekduia sp. Peel2402 TaxID=3458296 RepID=UPI00403E91B1